jgi:dienelactone hydrolase
MLSIGLRSLGRHPYSSLFVRTFAVGSSPQYFRDATVDVSFPPVAGSDRAACPGRMAVGKRKKYAVVVLQEWWGVNAQIKELASRLTQTYGFTTLIPDLYRGQVAIDHEHAGHLMSMLDWPGAVRHIAALCLF